MVLNAAGKMVHQVCQETPKVLQGVDWIIIRLCPIIFMGLLS